MSVYIQSSNMATPTNNVTNKEAEVEMSNVTQGTAATTTSPTSNNFQQRDGFQSLRGQTTFQE